MSKNDQGDSHLIDDPSPDECQADNIELEGPPRVSVCIPTLNDGPTLKTCLNSFEDQSYPDIEFIIVDGGSDDETLQIAEEFTENIYYDDGTLGSARQTGIDHATGEVIGLFDGDITLPHDQWLIKAIKLFNYSDRVSTVWPRNIAPPDAPPLTRLYFGHWDLIIEHRIRSQRGLYDGGNSLFCRAAIEDIGAIDPELHWGEDFDWSRKLKEAGYQVIYLRDPIYHDTMRSLRKFTKKQFVAAETFADTGFGLMDLSLGEICYEQFILGFKGMVRGLALERDPAWALFPPYMMLRTMAYAYTYLNNFVNSNN